MKIKTDNKPKNAQTNMTNSSDGMSTGHNRNMKNSL